MEARNSDLTPDEAWELACKVAREANFIRTRRESAFRSHRIDQFPALRAVLENEDIYVSIVTTASRGFFNMMGRKIFQDGETARERFLRAYRAQVQLSNGGAHD